MELPEIQFSETCVELGITLIRLDEKSGCTGDEFEGTSPYIMSFSETRHLNFY